MAQGGDGRFSGAEKRRPAAGRAGKRVQCGGAPLVGTFPALRAAQLAGSPKMRPRRPPHQGAALLLLFLLAITGLNPTAIAQCGLGTKCSPWEPGGSFRARWMGLSAGCEKPFRFSGQHRRHVRSPAALPLHKASKDIDMRSAVTAAPAARPSSWLIAAVRMALCAASRSQRRGGNTRRPRLQQAEYVLGLLVCIWPPACGRCTRCSKQHCRRYCQQVSADTLSFLGRPMSLLAAAAVS